MNYLLLAVLVASFFGCDKSQNRMLLRAKKEITKVNKFSQGDCLQQDNQVVKIISVINDDYLIAFLDELNRPFLQGIKMTEKHFLSSPCLQKGQRNLEPPVLE